jgi:hypothetical protein
VAVHAVQANLLAPLTLELLNPKKARSFKDSTWIRKNLRHYFFGRCRAGAAMEQRGRNFSTLEKMCLERAKAAEKEMEYWLAEAEEWARLKNATNPIAAGRAIQLDCFLEASER